MHTNESRFIATITGTERLSNTVNGNPRYRVSFADGPTRETCPDAQVAYMITNPENAGEPRTIIVDGKGRVIGVEK